MIADLLCLITKLISGLSVHWQGCVPEDKQRVYFANHTSHMDFMALWAALPRNIRMKTRPVAAKDYWAGGGIRRYIAQKVIHAILIERKHLVIHDTEQNPVHLMTQALDEGASLIIFPEGRRNTGEGLLDFKSGLFYLVKHKPGIEYIPVYLENLSRILPRGEFIMIPILGSVTFGAPLPVIPGETRDAFLERARRSVEILRGT